MPIYKWAIDNKLKIAEVSPENIWLMTEINKFEPLNLYSGRDVNNRYDFVMFHNNVLRRLLVQHKISLKQVDMIAKEVDEQPFPAQLLQRNSQLPSSFTVRNYGNLEDLN